MPRRPSEARVFATNKIKQARNRCGLTLHELSHKSGISVSHISRMERSTRGAKLDLIDAIASALGVTRSELVEQSAGRSLVVSQTIGVRTAVGHSASPENTFEIRIPDLYADAELHAYQVSGSCADRYYPNGSIVIWRSLGDSNEPLTTGRRYVVAHTRNGTRELSIKTFSRDHEGNEKLMHESDDPSHQSVLETRGEGVEILGRIVQSIRVD